MKHRIVYHNDPDGHCSAAIAGMALQSKGYEVVYQSADYGDAKIDARRDENLVIVDFCFQPDERMQEIIDFYGDRLTWIDHHQTSMPISAKNPDVRGKCAVEVHGEVVSACELTWDFYFPVRDMPVAVRTIGDWDTWRHATMKDSIRARHALEFKLFLDSQNTHPDVYFVPWTALFNLYDEFCAAVKKGEVLLQYQIEQNRKHAAGLAWEGVFLCVPAVFMNKRGNSMMFDSVYDEAKHKLMVGYEHAHGDHWTVSLYSTHEVMDCGVLAKRAGKLSGMGGGGHRGAAGFQTDWESFQKMARRYDE